MQNKYWYAVLIDKEDSDWGTGSYDIQEAIDMAKTYRKNGDPDAYVAVIDNQNTDPFCVNEIHNL